MIGQRIGLPTLVPIAVKVIEDDPLAEGDLFAGDLLTALLGLEREWWEANHHLRSRVVVALGAVSTADGQLQGDIDRFLTS